MTIGNDGPIQYLQWRSWFYANFINVVKDINNKDYFQNLQVSSSKRLTASSAFHISLASFQMVRKVLPNSENVLFDTVDEVVTNSQSISSIRYEIAGS